MLLGPHVALNKHKTYADALLAAQICAREHGIHIRTASIFVGNPRSRTISKNIDTKQLKATIERTGMRIFAHGVYPDIGIWQDKNNLAANFLIKELQVCSAAGIEGVVVHLSKDAIPHITTTLTKIRNLYASQQPIRIILETPAMRDSFYCKTENLIKLAQAVKKDDPDFVWTGFCIDTAHLWSSRINIRERKSAEEWLAKFNTGMVSLAVPYSAIYFHLNDSQQPFGCGRDEHAPLCEGKMWKGLDFAMTGCAAFIDYAIKHKIPLILERGNTPPIHDYKLIHKYVT